MKDFLGNELHVGDNVIYVGKHDKSLHRGEIKELETNNFKKEYAIIDDEFITTKYPHNIIKIQNNIDDMQTEFIGEVIDIFEDFLTEKNIDIPNKERDDEDDDIPLEYRALIYGQDYYDLEDRLKKMFMNWEIIKEDN